MIFSNVLHKNKQSWAVKKPALFPTDLEWTEGEAALTFPGLMNYLGCFPIMLMGAFIGIFKDSKRIDK